MRTNFLDHYSPTSPLSPSPRTQGPLPDMQRPWQSPVPPLEASVCEEVPFPTDEEDDSMVRIAWRGPQATVSVCGWIHIPLASSVGTRERSIAASLLPLSLSLSLSHTGSLPLCGNNFPPAVPGGDPSGAPAARVGGGAGSILLRRAPVCAGEFRDLRGIHTNRSTYREAGICEGQVS